MSRFDLNSPIFFEQKLAGDLLYILTYLAHTFVEQKLAEDLLYIFTYLAHIFHVNGVISHQTGSIVQKAFTRENS